MSDLNPISKGLTDFRENLDVFLGETVIDPGGRQILEWFSQFVGDKLSPAFQAFYDAVRSGKPLDSRNLAELTGLFHDCA